MRANQAPTIVGSASVDVELAEHCEEVIARGSASKPDPGSGIETLMSAVAFTYAVLLVACGAGDVVRDGVGKPTEYALSKEPIWTVGSRATEAVVGGSGATMFERISGGERLGDGSVVVTDAGAREVWKFGADGTHLWTVGRRGEGPGDFEELALLRNCSEGKIVTYDRRLHRVTEFGQGGELLGTWAVPFEETPPYPDQEVTCAPDGRIVYYTAGKFPSRPGMVRWEVPVWWASEGIGPHLLQELVPGPEKILGDGYWDRPWSKVLVLGGTGEGVWIGTSDDHLMELIGWDGTVVRTLRWSGDDLIATQDDADQLLEEFTDGDDEVEKERFVRESWPTYEEVLPTRVPAYARLIVSVDGSLWVGSWNGVTWWPRLPGHHGRRWDVFDVSGTWSSHITVPANMSVLDVGEDWVLVVVRDDHNVEILAIYEFRERP